MNRRLLVVTFHAPPEPAVGGLRWAGLSRHLLRAGWEVRMVTQSPGAGEAAAQVGLQVQTIPRRAVLQDHYRSWRQTQIAFSRGEGKTSPVDGDASPTVRARGSLRSGLAALLGFPDHGRGWVLRAARATRRAVHEWRPDAVVSTGPPHSVHLSVRLGLLGSQVPWVADFRDPWMTPFLGRFRPGWSLSVRTRLEADLFQVADLVLATTPELRDILAGAYPSANVAWLPNGVDASTLPRRSDTAGAGLRVTHLGSVYFNRDPSSVLRAFSAFVAGHPPASEASRLRLIGHISTDFRPGLDRLIADLGLERNVEIIAPVPRERALEMLADSELALVLAQGQDGMIPAKLYESVAMGVPTLVVTEPDSSSGREAVRLGAAVHRPDDEAGMVEAMTRAWRGTWVAEWEPPARVDHANLAVELDAMLRGLMRRANAR